MNKKYLNCFADSVFFIILLFSIHQQLWSCGERDDLLRQAELTTNEHSVYQGPELQSGLRADIILKTC